MYTENGAVLEADYPAWLAELEESDLKNTGQVIPGLLVATARDRTPQEWGQRLIAPMEGFFPFRGECLWVETGCTEWEQAASVPRHLARRCSAAAGLWGEFRGGAVIDLRWCSGTPLQGQLRTLEHFLLCSGGLLPLILVAPEALDAVRRQLALVDLQQILPAEEALRKSVEALTVLTQEEKRRLLEQPEYAAVMLRKVRRMGELGAMEVFCGEAPRRRRIGFGREEIG